MGSESRLRDRKIVVAVDESEESMYALSWCLNNLVSDQTHDSAATLVLLYVKPPPPAYPALDVSGLLFGNDVVASIEEWSRELVASVMTRAESVYRKSNSKIRVEKKVASGNPRDVICRIVERLEGDVLVMGTHGYGFIKRALLGSVSDHCAKHVKCPVVVVKHPKNL